MLPHGYFTFTFVLFWLVIAFCETTLFEFGVSVNIGVIHKHVYLCFLVLRKRKEGGNPPFTLLNRLHGSRACAMNYRSEVRR